MKSTGSENTRQPVEVYVVVSKCPQNIDSLGMGKQSF